MNEESTNIVFILGSGRCGTFQISKLFEENNEVTCHHEFLFDYILRSSVLYKMQQEDKTSIKKLLIDTHQNEIKLADSKIWIDSSNALPWVADVLLEIFPNAKFIHLIRDGRKVVSSFYNKFPKVMYNDFYVKKLATWLENKDLEIKPPPYKNYWRPLPEYCKCFIKATPKNRFEYLCWYWAEINSHINNFKNSLKEENFLEIKLEDLSSKKEHFDHFLNFIGIDSSDDLFSMIKKPVNVAEPKNYFLDENQTEAYNNMCKEVAEKYNYHDKDEYAVKY